MLVVADRLPGVPLDDELLAVLSVGLPVGLAIYLAWVAPGLAARDASDSGSPPRSPARSAGAWLGFHATTRPVRHRDRRSAGAVAGANLALILFDMVAGRSGAVGLG